MAIPTWTVGEVLTASDVNSWFVPLNGTKATNSTYSSTSLANDADLQVSAAASCTYDVRAVLFFSCATGDQGLQTQLYGPSGATWSLANVTAITSGATIQGGVNTDTTGSFELHLSVTNSQVTSATFDGTLFMSSTAGAFGFKFAEHTASNPVAVLAGSKLTAWRVA